MAAQQRQSPLRRWKRFFPMFNTIDAAIVASSKPAGNGKQRDEALKVLRQATGDIVQDLCEAPADDPAEDLCRILDTVMVEYLFALKAVTVPSSEPADLARALRALQEHECAHIRSLARRIVGMWREPPTPVVKVSPPPLPMPNKANIHRTTKPPTKGKIDRIRRVEPTKREMPLRKKSPPVVRANKSASIKKAKPTPKKPTLVGNGSTGNRAGMITNTKRKLQLQEGYQETADAKRQRKIQVIQQAPKMVEVEQRQQKMNPIPISRERSRAGCGVPTTARRPLLPAFQKT